MIVMPSGPNAVAIVNLGANRSTAQRKISWGVADSSCSLSAASSSRKASVGTSGGSAARAPREASSAGSSVRTCSVEEAVGGNRAESESGSAAVGCEVDCGLRAIAAVFQDGDRTRVQQVMSTKGTYMIQIVKYRRLPPSG